VDKRTELILEIEGHLNNPHIIPSSRLRAEHIVDLVEQYIVKGTFDKDSLNKPWPTPYS